METIEMEENTHENSIKKEGSEQNSGNYVYGKVREQQNVLFSFCLFCNLFSVMVASLLPS